jgi:hypothetical protein
VFANLDTRSIERADRKRTVQGKLHVAVPEASISAVEICSDRSAAGPILSAKLTFVIGQEHDPQEIANDWIPIDDFGHILIRSSGTGLNPDRVHISMQTG